MERIQEGNPLQRIFQFGDFRFDPSAPLLTRGSALVDLAPKALEILSVLVTNAGQVVRKDDLLSLVWPGTVVEEGNLAVHVSSLRKAFGDHGNEIGYIETIPKRGYRFVAPVQRTIEPGAITPINASGPFWLAEHYMQQNTPDSCRRATELYRKSVEIDPLNGRAWAGVADSLLLWFISGDLGREEGLGAAVAMLSEAKKLYPGCSEIHLALSRLNLSDWQWQRAGDEVQHGLELATDTATKLFAETWHGSHLARLDDLDRGVRLLRRATLALPLHPRVWSFLAEAYYLARDFAPAAAVSAEALQLHPHCWYLRKIAGKAAAMLGDYAGAMRQLRVARLLYPEPDPYLLGDIAYVHALAGRRDRAAALLARMSRPGRRQASLISIAKVQAALGDRHQALDNIEGAFAMHDWYIWGLKRDCCMDPLRTDPRFRSVSSKAGL